MKTIFNRSVFFLGFLANMLTAHAIDMQNTKETLVFMRHGEKQSDEIGQINCQGLNRALKLPAVLTQKFGTPHFILAPNPSVKILNKVTEKKYDYVRPLSTIEPVAVLYNLPINTNFGFDDTTGLTNELLRSKYNNSTVFIAWEHKKIVDVVRSLYTQVDGYNANDIPVWGSSDFDSLFVLEIEKNSDDKVFRVTFRKDAENLNGQSEICP